MNTLAWRTCTLLCLYCATVVLFFACRKPVRSTMFATLEPADTGIDFSNDLPDEDASDDMNIVHYLYYYNGGGVAAGDLNNDGLPDLYFAANRGGNKLYINKGGFKFEDATERAGAGGTGSWKTGVSLADVNADGWLDIYICQVGRYKSFEGKNQLLINNRDGTFTDKAAEYGLDLSAFCTQAVFFDYDLDGDLDCFVLCHSVHSPESYKDTSISRQYDRLSSDHLFRNDGGVFTDVTAASGLHDGKSGYG
ncbi:MAG: VCBS repeat-containing protein, partial [Saprospiraceae bacterium]|nr:VCBS repeat-containing protein [Saprospiraceae bacterium]